MNGCCQICGKQDIELFECLFGDVTVFAGRVCASKKYGKAETKIAIDAAKAAKQAEKYEIQKAADRAMYGDKAQRRNGEHNGLRAVPPHTP